MSIESERMNLYHRTKNGLVTQIYNGQKASSKRRGDVSPEYTLKELREWMFSQDNFTFLYDSWVRSGHKKLLSPSCDRLDDYKPYTLGNLQLITWSENKAKGERDRKNGINNKVNKAVSQSTKEGELIKEHHSVSYAHRSTGIPQPNISACCSGYRKSAGGYLWAFA